MRKAQDELYDISQTLNEIALDNNHNHRHGTKNENLHDKLLNHLSRAKQTMNEIHKRRKDSMTGKFFENFNDF